MLLDYTCESRVTTCSEIDVDIFRWSDAVRSVYNKADRGIGMSLRLEVMPTLGLCSGQKSLASKL